MKKTSFALLGAALLASASAAAHVSISSGPAVARSSNEVTFTVGHGCERAGGGTGDTTKVVIDIPAGVTNVRLVPPPPPFSGVITSTAGATTVTFSKGAVDALPEDTNFYKFAIRVTAPDAPFTTIYFPSHQLCEGANGGEPGEWTVSPSSDAGSGNAPSLVVMPSRQPGWNRYTVPVAVTDVATIFKDAQIVWKGTAAYSPNAVTAAQLEAEPGVTRLAALAANDEIWAKY